MKHTVWLTFIIIQFMREAFTIKTKNSLGHFLCEANKILYILIQSLLQRVAGLVGSKISIEIPLSPNNRDFLS